MRFFALSLLLLPGGAGFAAILPQPVFVSTDITWTSDYVFRGVRVAKDGFQPNVEIAAGDLYGGIWGNFPVSDVHATLHYYGGIGIDAPDIDFLELDTGFTVYHYPDSDRDRTYEFYLGGLFSHPARPAWRGALFYFYDFDVESHVGEGSVSWLRSLERIGLPAALEFSVHAGVQGASGGSAESYHYYGGSVALPYSLTAFSVFTVGVGYGTAEKYTFAPGEKGDTVFWSVGYSTFF